jgi:carbon-monoxide dehydrogenase medium subunit
MQKDSESMRGIIEYHRPVTLEAALALLARPQPFTRALAGGAHQRGGGPACEARVDLGALGLSYITQSAQTCCLGATVTLEDLAAAEGLPPALCRAAIRQAPRNTRQRATVGGTIAIADPGPLLTCLLALDGRLDVAPGGRTIALADYLAGDAATRRERGLILALAFAAKRCVGLAEIARTPADAPLLCVAVGAELEDGRLVRVTVAAGGAGQPLTLCRNTAALLEGSPVGADVAFNAADEAVAWCDDGRASADYRRAMLPVLVRRACVEAQAACEEIRHEG